MRTSCPTRGKLRFASEREANRRIMAFWLKYPHKRHHPQRAYFCECGWWHMTSRTREEYTPPSRIEE